MALEAGTKIGHYVILSQLGEGGMGEVYLAEDTRLPRRVAVKLLAAKFTKETERVRRFEQEARAASALNHPNIITILEVGHLNEHHFIITEYIEGEMLRDRIARAPVGLREALDIALQIASALTAAHSSGIIHRDIKPENIMLRPDGYVKVLDFGLAKLTEKSGGHGVLSSDPDAITKSLIHTDPGIVMGTVNYMSPEQARGFAMDGRTDIFSLGVTLYEMITGRKPFDSDTLSDVIALILYKNPPPLARYTDEVPPEMERIVLKALAKDREERYQSAKDLTLDLRRLKQQLDVAAELERSPHPAGPPEAARATSDNHRTTVMASNDFQTIEATNAIAQAAGSGAVRTTSSAEYILTEIKRHKRGFLFSIAAILVAVASLTFFFAGGKPKTIDSIAVLPFVNTGSDAGAENLSDNFTENVINNLSRLPGLRVMSFSSVYRFKMREAQAAFDPRAAGRDLGVRAVLTGRFLQQGDNLTINVELVDALDNAHLWGSQYKRKFTDILLLQQEIARDLSDKLQLSLSREERQRLESDQLYLRGRSLWNKRTPESLKSAAEVFQQAIERDAGNAKAYAGLADCYTMLVLYSALAPKEGFPKAKEAATKAIELDDSLAEAHTSLAFVKYRFDWDWAGADREFNRAVDLGANYATAHQWYGNYLTAMGHMGAAITEARHAQEIDRLSLVSGSQLAWVLYFAGQYDQGIDICKKTLELDPNFYVARRYLGLLYEQKQMYPQAIAEFQQAVALGGGSLLMKAHLGHAYAIAGDRAQAQQILNELQARAAQAYVPAYLAAVIYAGLGDKDRAFAELEKAYEARDEFLVYLKTDPRLVPLRADPRFGSLAQRLGFP